MSSETPFGDTATAGIRCQVLGAVVHSSGGLNHPPGVPEIKASLADAGFDLSNQAIRNHLQWLRERELISGETGEHPNHGSQVVYSPTDRGKRVFEAVCEWWLRAGEAVDRGEIETAGQRSSVNDALNQAIEKAGLASVEADGGESS